VTAASRASYNRILLSSVLADERPLAEIGIQPSFGG
jgi:hypothetical protein